MKRSSAGFANYKATGRCPRRERADWAYGNAAIENDLVTKKMAQQAVARLAKKK